MITRVSLRGWKSHLDSEFGFSPGVNALIGVMGSGKTSVMQAVTFALFGSLPEIQSRKISLSDLVMNKPGKRRQAEVEVGFTVRGKNYVVKRRIERGRGTAEAEIREEGRILEASPQGVTREVERILGMDYDLFCRAVYSEQNRIDYFLRVPRGQRTQQIDRMLHVDRFEAVRERSVSISNRLMAEAGEKAKILEELKRERPGERKESLEREITGMRKEAASLEARAGKLLEEEKALARRIGGLEKREQEAQKAGAEMEGLLSGIREVGSSISSARTRSGGRSAEEIEKQLSDLREGVGRLEREIGNSRELMEEKRGEMASVETKIRMVTAELEGLKGMGAKCPLCERAITRSRRDSLVKGRESSVSALRERAGQLARSVQREKAFLEGAERSLKRSLEGRERLLSVIGQLSSLRELEGRRKKYMERKRSLGRRLASLERELGASDIRGMREELRKRASERSGIEARVSALGDRIADRSSALEEAGKRVALAERYEGEVRKSGRVAADLKRFVSALKGTQERLREEFLKSVNSVMGSVWGELYPYSDFTGIRLLAEGDYVLQLRDSTGWVPVDGIASGGERSMAALALRIAFSLAFVPNLRWLILDEPTHNLDGNAIRRFTDSLKEGMSSFAEQVFLITHDDRISEGADSLHRLERDKDRDGPTVVSAVLQQ